MAPEIKALHCFTWVTAKHPVLPMLPSVTAPLFGRLVVPRADGSNLPIRGVALIHEYRDHELFLVSLVLEYGWLLLCERKSVLPYGYDVTFIKRLLRRRKRTSSIWIRWGHRRLHTAKCIWQRADYPSGLYTLIALPIRSVE
jgi:hypothetical protein